MKKILELNSKHFLGGLAISPWDENRGIWDVLEGIDIFRYPGLLGSGYTATDARGATVTDQIKAFCAFTGTPAVPYVYAHSVGKLYRFNASNDITANGTLGAIPRTLATTGGQALLFYRGSIVYVQNTQIGCVNDPGAVDPVFNDVGIGGAGVLTTNTYHPAINGPDGNLYIADGNAIDQYNGTTDIYTANKLVLGAGYTITSLAHDGYYLIIGATQHPTAAYGMNQAEVFFWDTWSGTFNKTFVMPDADITALKTFIDGYTYAFTRWGIYRFNYSTLPTTVIHEMAGMTNLYCEALQEAVDLYNGMLLFGSVNGWVYGSPDNRLAKVFYTPIRVAAGGTANAEIVALKVIGPTKIYVSSATNQFYVFKTGNASATATTSLIDLKKPFKIGGIKVYTKALASGDSLTVSATNEAGTSIISGTFSYAVDGTKTSKLIRTIGTARPYADAIIISLAFTGNVRVKRIDLFGDLADEIYADTR